MSKMKRLLEEWLDDAILELDEMQERFEEHAKKMDKVLLGESDIDEDAKMLAQEMVEDFAMEAK